MRRSTEWMPTEAIRLTSLASRVGMKRQPGRQTDNGLRFGRIGMAESLIERISFGQIKARVVR